MPNRQDKSSELPGPEPVVGSDFAGIWGGAVLADWRGQGIYRARTALGLGKTLIHSDSTAYSQPILERSGLIAVSSTTPFEWETMTSGSG